MRTVIFVLACLLAGGSCQKAPRYVVDGNISGNAEGMKVMLNKMGDRGEELVDSTFIKNGKFVFEGVLDEPAYYAIQIDRTPKGEVSSVKYFTNSRFYLENSPISFSGNIDSLTPYFWNKKPTKKAVITGSAMEDLYQKYWALGEKQAAELRKLNDEYMEEYHLPSMNGVFNTERGIEIARKMEKLEKQLADIKWDFVKENIQTVVGYDLAKQYFQDMYVRITPEQIDELEVLVDNTYPNTEKATKFKALAEKGKRVAVGTKYSDIELVNPEGKKVKLSEYVPEGKYVMLEFWASWCGPCRGEIPHLREVYKKYKDKGFEIVSISIDRKDQDWKKAMKEENMVWTQLNDPGEFDGPVAQVYNIQGVPTCIILDKEGHIFKTDMRGAQLDAVLDELYD